MACSAAAVLVGKSGLGRWHIQEARAFLREFMEAGRPVIPVLLPGATPKSLPLFLREMTWVDFRKEEEAALTQLIWGITGRRPKTFD